MSTTILMAEAVKLQDTLEKKIADLIGERSRNATMTIDKGEEAELPERSVDFITGELAEVRVDLRVLKAIMRDSNSKTLVQWDGTGVAIATALDLAKDLRSEANFIKALGGRKKLDRNSSGHFAANAVTTFTVALYEPMEYRKAGEKNEALADKLSMLIQTSNGTTQVAVPFAGKYMIV